jgi:hypothetical protein
MAVYRTAEIILWAEIAVLVVVALIGLGYMASRVRERVQHQPGVAIH